MIPPPRDNLERKREEMLARLLSDIQEFKRFVSQYMPHYNLDDLNAVPGYNCAFAITEVLKRCGDELTRENLLKQATSLKELALPMLLNEIKVSNSPTNYAAFHAMELIQFDGER